MIVYRHCRVVFGVSCSPFLLAATLAHHLEKAPDHLKELAKKLKDSMYVDNCVASVDSIEELENFRSESRKLLASAKFDLRGWQNNHFANDKNSHLVARESFNLNDVEDNYQVQVLGLSWNTHEDRLSCDIKDMNVDEPITKRKILSLTHKVFDPIGYTCPFTLIPKLLLQECWKSKATWDSKLPDHIVKEFMKWKNQLSNLKSFNVPRRFSELPLLLENMSLHVFCDACQKSYATCIYLRVEHQDKVTCQLVQARSRVAPLKNVTIPRLELLACTIGARLANTVRSDLRMENVETFYWSDAMDALHWIKRDGTWAIFVANRVKEIRDLSPVNSWNFVPGLQNPADLPSRGCSLKKLIEEKWSEGPLWLQSSKEMWPNFELSPNLEVVNGERKKTVVSVTNSEPKDENFYDRISSYPKIIRVTAWILRFSENCRIPKSLRLHGELGVNEIEIAELRILKLIQKKAFPKATEGKIRPLQPIIDEKGILRIKSRVLMREDTENFRFPIILPSDNLLVKKLILWKHLETGHSGTQTLMCILREKYWIIKSRKAIKQVISQCVRCLRFSAPLLKVPSTFLPADRVRDTACFEITGVDFAGPLLLKGGQKAWIVLYTCAVFRAVHIELVTSMSTEVFLQSLRRFIARRGRPTIIYSDNGSNFVGANNALKRLDVEKLMNEVKLKKITWKFIPPAAPWWGGWWERIIGMMKQLLRKVLGQASLRYEEMYTVLCDTECLLNSRPLTYL